MALSAYAMQYLNQIGGLLTRVEITDQGEAKAFKLVPATFWHNGKRFPHDIQEELKVNEYRRVTNEGLEYILIPESTINAQGTVSRYGSTAQEAVERTQPEVTTAPPAVQKYLKSESRKIKRLG